MRRCLITGGSGFLGLELANRVLREGWDVTILDRNEITATEITPHVRFVKGDVRDFDTVLRTASGADVIFHLAAVVPLTRAGKHFRGINVEGTKNVLEAGARQSAARVVHLSTSAVYGIPQELPLREYSPLKPLGQYGHTKLEAERVCAQYRSRGLPVVIIRPRTIVGMGRLGIFQILFDWIRRGKPVLIIGSGDNLFQLVSARDLVEACVSAADRGGSADFVIGAAQYSTVRSDLEQLARHAGTGSRVRSINAPMAKLALRVLDKVRLSPLVDWHYLTADKPFYFDISKAKQMLAWHPQDSNVAMLVEAYDWYSENYQEYEHRYGRTHQGAVPQGLLRILRAIL